MDLIFRDWTKTQGLKRKDNATFEYIEIIVKLVSKLIFVCLVIIRFAAEFDFRTFDPEGVVLYAESSQDSWFMLGLRAGRIEVQFKNQHTFKVTSGGKAVNDGQWHVVREICSPVIPYMHLTCSLMANTVVAEAH